MHGDGESGKREEESGGEGKDKKGKRGGRPSVGEAIKGLKKLKMAEKPVVGYHRDGTIKYFRTVAEASRYCTCSVTFIETNANTGRFSGTGWKFEWDN